MLAQRWIRYAPCSPWQLCMAAGLDKACVPVGLLKDFLRGHGHEYADRTRFQVLKLTCQECACRAVKLVLRLHPFPITLSPVHEIKLLSMVCVAYCSSCANITYYLSVRKKQRSNENIKGSLLWLRYYNSPKLFINRCISNTFLFLSKLFFHICTISVFW